VKEHAPTIDPVMIPYRFTGGNFAAKTMKVTKAKYARHPQMQK